MSNMLQQAIIDAKALKEAALKNAEAEIVEKYAPEVKKVMQSILEAEDEDLADEDATDMGIPDNAASVEDPTAMDLPLGAAPGENACPCPDEDEEIVLDLPGLAAIVADEEPAIDDLENTETELAPAIEDEEEPIALEEDELASVIAELLGETEETLEENETVEEVSLEEGPRDPPTTDPSGERPPQPVAIGYDEEEYQPGVPMELPQDQDERRPKRPRAHESIDLKKIAGKKNELLETIKALQVQNDNFKADNKKLLSGMSEQKKNLRKLATTLENLSLQNAKLLYTNEVLKTASLNERQKQIAVEALHEVKTVEHAKTVFETLQSTVVSTKRRGRPESLSEVVSNNTSIRVPRRKEQKISNPHENRWKLLAGIK